MTKNQNIKTIKVKYKMFKMRIVIKSLTKALALCVLLLLAACGGGNKDGELPSASFVSMSEGPSEKLYVVGPGDQLQIFVWKTPELTTNVIVRPDGRFSVPLIHDMPATGKTPTQLARDIEKQLGDYIENPIVTVIVSDFNGPYAQQVRIVGSAASPQAIPYRANMTLLDVMISVGGVTDFAAGNRATLARVVDGKQFEYRIRIDDLLKDGDVSANVKIEPGDVIIIPESFF